jgi:hypothetical protein
MTKGTHVLQAGIFSGSTAGLLVAFILILLTQRDYRIMAGKEYMESVFKIFRWLPIQCQFDTDLHTSHSHMQVVQTLFDTQMNLWCWRDLSQK